MQKFDQEPGSGEEPTNTGESAANGDAVAKLFREHNQSLVRFLAGRLASDAEAKEVAQEAYVRLLQLDRPSGGFLRALLFKIATNIATDHLRRRRLERTANSVDPFDFGIDHATPERHVGGAREIEVVLSSLQGLSARCRQAVLLARVEGLSSTEIAAELSISTRMVRRYVAEAILVIRDRLERTRRERAPVRRRHQGDKQ